MDSLEVYKDGEDQWRWRYRHENGNVMADSGQGYTNASDMLHGAMYVMWFTSYDKTKQQLYSLHRERVQIVLLGGVTLDV